MQLPEPFRFVDEGLPFGFAEGLPAGAQIFADDGIVHVWGDFADLAPLDLAPHHERVHRAFDVTRAVFFRLWRKREKRRLLELWTMVDMRRKVFKVPLSRASDYTKMYNKPTHALFYKNLNLND